MSNLERPFFSSLKRLEKWFQCQKRILPWRNQPSPYRVWISEIMLQQTQVITVVPYFEKFIQRFPTIEALAAAEEQEVLFYWAGLGYYSRARNIYRTAKKILALNHFPETVEGWLEMPGVGPYTAGAILSIASNQARPILDGNVERVLSRIRKLNRDRGDTFYKKRLWKLSTFFVEFAAKKKILPSILNQALMELGATICTPKKQKCSECPLSEICQAYRFQEVDAYPPKKKPKEWIAVKEKVSCVMNPKGYVLLQQRNEKQWRAGLWDFLEEIPQDLKKQLKHLGSIESKHIVTRHKIQRQTEVWLYDDSAQSVRWKAGEKLPLSHHWVSIENPHLPVGSALKKTLARVHQDFLMKTPHE